MDFDFREWILNLAGACRGSAGIPVSTKETKVPYAEQFSVQLWIVVHAFFPIALEIAYKLTWCGSLSALSTWVLYSAALVVIILREFHEIHRLVHIYGFMNGDAGKRNRVDRSLTGHVAISLFKITAARVGMTVYLTYMPAMHHKLLSAKWWIQLSFLVSVYCVLLDFFFYWYHRLLHCLPWLQRYHRAHHTVIYPTAMLSAFADAEQQFFEFAVLPLMTFYAMRWLGLHLDFYQWWTCQVYVIFSEIWGHSGLRVHFSPPMPFIHVLFALGLEGAAEDHDIHHRFAFRRPGGNFSKQTRIWDRLFGTDWPRVETATANIDFDDRVRLFILYGDSAATNQACSAHSK